MNKKNTKHLVKPKTNVKKISEKQMPTLQLKSERDIAMDFAQKVYIKFDKMVKAIILFGSSVKHTNVVGSDIDIIILLDNASIKFDEKLIFWYREELGKIIQENPYKQDLHINTVTLTTWWNDLTRGDPTVINIIRYGDVLIDFGGFFGPLRALLEQGKIKPTPEAIYTCLNRVPIHITNSKQAEISAIEGSYWAMVDTAQSLLMSIKVLPPSREHIAILLKENFVDKNMLKMKYVIDFRDLHDLHRKVMHGEIQDINGGIIDSWQKKAEDFFNVAIKIIEEIV
ncbi:MAG: nucleotidyltransferase domain-containing protein [Candidatus Pacearchaeota archaeon]|jgi:predicted nucleotidyltransferase/uncharacterized protein (UPF0332 family)